MIPKEQKSGYTPSPTSLEPQSVSSRGSRRILLVLAAVMVAAVGATSWLLIHNKVARPNSSSEAPSLQAPNFGTAQRVSLSYSSSPPGTAVTISSFQVTNTTPVQELSHFDTITKYEGISSLDLRSTNQVPDSFSINQNFDFSQTQLFEAMVDSADLSTVESLVFIFDSATSPASFDYPANVSGSGWTPLRMPRANFVASNGAVATTWSNIGSVEIELISRPGTYASVNVGLLRAEPDPAVYKGNWSVADPAMLGLLQAPHGTALLFRNTTANVGVLSDVGDAKDFRLTAELAPMTTGFGGLFFRGDGANGFGYAFVIGGVSSNVWQIIRSDSNGLRSIRQGTIPITSFQADGTYWLRSVAKGPRIDLYISLDGTTYVDVATIDDDSFGFGEVGIAVYQEAAYAIYGLDFERR